MRSSILILAALVAAVVPARATGGVWCNAEDASVRFAMRSGLSHGINGGFLSFQADLDVKLKAVPEDFLHLHFDDAGVSQRWLDDKVFKLRIFRERETGPSGDLVFLVETTRIREGEYRGRYELTIGSMQSAQDYKGTQWHARGKVSCSSE